MKKLLITISILIGTLTVSQGTIINVPGDYSTIQAAINAANNTDTIIVSDGTYSESIDFLGKAIVVASNFILDKDIIHIDSTIINPGGTATGVNISSGEDSTSKLIGFTITGCGGLNNAGVRCYQGSPFISNNRIIDNVCRAIILYQSRAIILENEIHGNPILPTPYDAIYMSQSRPRIERNNIYASDPNGNINAIYHSSDSSGIVIRKNIIIGRIFGDFFGGGTIDHNLIIAGNGFSSAMNLTGGDSGLVIINNTIIGGGGIFLQGAVPHIINNIIAYANTGIEVWSSFASFKYNDIWECTTPYSGISDQTGLNGNISKDPFFINKSINDYHLLPSSPCIDAGDPNSDFSNEPEPNGDHINIGAYGGISEATISIPIIFINPTIIDFGYVVKDSSKQLNIGIYNIGHDSLYITDILSSNNVFTTNFNPNDSLILPYDSLEIKITFVPNDSINYIDSLIIINNDTNEVIYLMGNSITGIDEYLLIEQRVNIYPNPTNNIITISFENLEPKITQLQILDITGKVLYQKQTFQINNESNLSYDLSKFISGTYFMRIKVDKIIINRKILKQ